MPSRTFFATALFAALCIAAVYSLFFFDTQWRRQRAVASFKSAVSDIRLGVSIRPSQQILIHGLNSCFAYDRVASLVEIRKLGKDACFASPIIVALTKDQHRVVQREAVLTIVELGPCAAEAAPRLAFLLQHEDGDIPIFCVRALAKIGPSALPFRAEMHRAMTSRDEMLHAEAKKALDTVERLWGDEASNDLPVP